MNPGHLQLAAGLLAMTGSVVTTSTRHPIWVGRKRDPRVVPSNFGGTPLVTYKKLANDKTVKTVDKRYAFDKSGNIRSKKRLEVQINGLKKYKLVPWVLTAKRGPRGVLRS